MLHTLLNIVLPVFAVVALGWVLAGAWSAGGGGAPQGPGAEVSHPRPQGLEVIHQVLLFGALPALILHSLSRHPLALASLWQLGGSALGVTALVGGVAFVATRLLGLPSRGIVLTAAFMNSGNFGLPFSQLTWGEDAFALAVLFYVSMAVAHNTFGLWIAKGRLDGWKEMFRLPLLYAAVVGLILSLTDTRLPPPVAAAVEMVGDMAVPLMLLSLGFTLRTIHASAVGAALLATVLRFGGGFAAAALMVKVVGADGLARKVIFMSSTMPSAVLNVVLAQRYRADPQVVAGALLLSTLGVVITVPLLVAWLG